MKLLSTILFMALALPALAVVTNPAPYQPAPDAPKFSSQDRTTQILVKVTTNGVSRYVYPSVSDFFGGVVFEVDSNSFTVANGKLYAKSINSGDFVGFTTNVGNAFAAGFNFTNSSRLVLGSAPSFDFSTSDGVASGGGMDPTAPAPVVEWSADNSNTWHDASESTNVPVLVSVYCPTTYGGATISNVTVYSYVNFDLIGTTNDQTGQTTYVSQTSDSRSVVNVAGAHAIGATEASNWANYPATAKVNAAGNGVQLNNTWSVTTTGNKITVAALGAAALTLEPSSATAQGTNATIDSLTITNGGLTFAVSSPTTNQPTIVWTTNLTSPTWTALLVTNAYTTGGEWYLQAAEPSTSQAYFKAYSSGTVGPAVLELVAGGMRYSQFTSAPIASQIGGDATHTNHLLLNVSGALVDYWSNGTTVWSKTLAP